MATLLEHPRKALLHVLCTVGAKVIRDYLQGLIEDAGFETRRFLDENKKKIKKRNLSDARKSTNPEENLQTDLLQFQLEILNVAVGDSPYLEYFDLPILMNLLLEVGNREVIQSPLTTLIIARDMIFELNNPTYAMTCRLQEFHIPEFDSYMASLFALDDLGYESGDYPSELSVKYLEHEIAESQRSSESWYFQCYGSNDQVKRDITDELFSSLNLLKVGVKGLLNNQQLSLEELLHISRYWSNSR